jgi:hypothetical protein
MDVHQLRAGRSCAARDRDTAEWKILSSAGGSVDGHRVPAQLRVRAFSTWRGATATAVKSLDFLLPGVVAFSPAGQPRCAAEGSGLGVQDIERATAPGPQVRRGTRGGGTAGAPGQRAQTAERADEEAHRGMVRFRAEYRRSSREGEALGEPSERRSSAQGVGGTQEQAGRNSPVPVGTDEAGATGSRGRGRGGQGRG